MTSQFIASVAAISLLGAGVAASSETRSYAVLPALTSTSVANGEGASGQKCRVEVVREGMPGAADVARTVLDNGDCLCTVRTGPANNNGSAESIVVALLRDRECTNPVSAGQLAQGAGGGGGIGGALPFVLGGLAVAGGVAVGLGGKKSPG